ncbi:MAG: FIST C-terminal domain-containing protein [Sulfurimicrobium sp.]|nr:FIST C-terminal domain-containing protein [Sulfurimicrobium sp.]
MKIEQRYWTEKEGWRQEGEGRVGEAANWVLVFGAPDCLTRKEELDAIRAAFPQALITGCSTAGEICGTRVRDDSLALTAVQFEGTRLELAVTELAGGDSYAAGKTLAATLDPAGLRHVLVLSDGLLVNGSELVKGLRDHLPPDVAATGGLAGDGSRFQHALVWAGGEPAAGRIAALGFYGDRIRVGYGSLGGWDTFGPERLITRSSANVLYELDGQSALALYKTYLGEHAAGLPSTGLLFPLALRLEGGEYSVVRTLLAVNEDDNSMTFAGDMPEGVYARLMKANFDRLVDGASDAARAGYATLGGTSPELAILISCVGRKLVLKQRIEEEVEGVREVLGERTALTGFYSYGEICPHDAITRCELHNQTMTITTFSEN